MRVDLAKSSELATSGDIMLATRATWALHCCCSLRRSRLDQADRLGSTFAYDRAGSTLLLERRVNTVTDGSSSGCFGLPCLCPGRTRFWTRARLHSATPRRAGDRSLATLGHSLLESVEALWSASRRYVTVVAMRKIHPALSVRSRRAREIRFG